MIICMLQMVNVVLKVRARPAARRPRAPAPLLDGIRNADWMRRPALARRIGAALAVRGEVAYCVEGANDRRAPPPAHNLLAELLDSLRREVGRFAAAFHATGSGLPTAIVPR
jgi:hypothetical protein